MAKRNREGAPERLRVGVLWRGPPGAERPAADRGLGPLFDAFASLSVEVIPVPFSEERAREVADRLAGLDGVLVWVNPIQDGVNRERVDELLREAATSGIWVSAHPGVIEKMGTKEVLFTTRHLAWGTDTDLYRSIDELAERLPGRLAQHRRLVLKQARGNGGNGVWSVELVEPDAPATLRSPARVREARATGSPAETVSLDEFVRRCEPYFAWSAVLVDQKYQPRLVDGMIRCYFSGGEVVGFCHQWPRGLLEVDSTPSPTHRLRPVMEGPDGPAYQLLRRRAEDEWVPDMMRLFGLDAQALPVIWDADFLLGPDDDYVLCEINVSAVWPFPPMASTIIAANTLARIAAAVR